MDERKYVDWDYSMPGISFCLKSGRVTIFKTTLEVIGYPEFYRFLYNPDTKMMAIEPCDFVRMMYRENGWKKQISYRIAGTPHRQERAVEFDLRKALEIHEGRVMEP